MEMRQRVDGVGQLVSDDGADVVVVEFFDTLDESAGLGGHFEVVCVEVVDQLRHLCFVFVDLVYQLYLNGFARVERYASKQLFVRDGGHHGGEHVTKYSRHIHTELSLWHTHD
jgi:hypothetical protein